MKIKCIVLGFVLIPLLTCCSVYDFSGRLVQQGNLLPQSKIARLTVGMSKENAAILMGTSMLSPTFTHDRWDYAYTSRKGSGQTHIRHLSLYFVHGSLTKIENSP